MNWLTNFVRPKIRALVAQDRGAGESLAQVPGLRADDLPPRPGGQPHGLPHCGHHMRIGVKQRLELLFDDGAFDRIELPKVELDPLHFRDRKRYTDRLQGGAGEDRASRMRSSSRTARSAGIKAVVAAFNFDFMGGSMGVAVGEGLVPPPSSRSEQRGADRRSRLGRRAHAGRHPLADADAAHRDRGRPREGGRPALHRAADRSDHRRRHRLLRHAGRHPHRRARRA